MELMLFAIDRNLSAAWFAGMREAGFSPGEISPEEDNARVGLIVNQAAFRAGLAAFIMAQRSADKPVTTTYPRIATWANRWNEAKNAAKMMAQGDPKLRWNLGIAEHCASCKKLDGKVKRQSFWMGRGVWPQGGPSGTLPNQNLECRGWECKCQFTITNEPLSRGPLPRLP